MLPPAGDLAALLFLTVTGSGGRGDGPSVSQRTTAPVAPGLQLHHEAGRLYLPFPAAPALPGENQVSPPGGKQSWQQEAEGRWAVEKEHAQPRQGAFPGPLTCCQGPASTAPASMQTRVGRGARRTPGPLPSSPVPHSRPSASPQPPPGLQSTHTDQTQAELLFSCPLLKHTLTLWKRGWGRASWQRPLRSSSDHLHSGSQKACACSRPIPQQVPPTAQPAHLP